MRGRVTMDSAERGELMEEVSVCVCVRVRVCVCVRACVRELMLVMCALLELVCVLSLQIEKLKAEVAQLKASNTTQTAEALAGRDQKDVVREC